MSDETAPPQRGRKEKPFIQDSSTQAAEQIIRIPLFELHPFPDHPYGIREDQAMQDTVDSVKANGVVVPAIVRPRAEGGYEIVAGHRRKLASEQAGFPDMPCIVRNLTDNEAIIQLVDSNAQREDVLPSERARAYKMSLDAIKRTAGRPRRELSEKNPLSENSPNTESCPTKSKRRKPAWQRSPSCGRRSSTTSRPAIPMLPTARAVIPGGSGRSMRPTSCCTRLQRSILIPWA